MVYHPGGNRLQQDGSLLSPERAATLAWAKQIASRAKAEGKVLLTMTHFGGDRAFSRAKQFDPRLCDRDGNKSASYLSGLSWDSYSESYTGLDGSASTLTYNSSSEYVSRELAKAGINLLLTGHFHANDIARRSYSDGSYLVDVETGSTVSYPAPAPVGGGSGQQAADHHHGYQFGAGGGAGCQAGAAGG